MSPPAWLFAIGIVVPVAICDCHSGIAASRRRANGPLVDFYICPDGGRPGAASLLLAPLASVFYHWYILSICTLIGRTIAVWR